MLDTEPIQITDMVLDAEQDLYYAANPHHFWIRGPVVENGAHLTLLYGFIQHATEIKAEIDEVLRDWRMPMLEIEKIGAFKTPFEDEPYSCIVAHIKKTPALLEGHARLELLPHVNTFAEYRPHITLAYVKKEAERKWLREIGNELIGKKLAVQSFNYGSKRG